MIGGHGMKNPKNPTLKQKQRLKSLGLIPQNWLILRDVPAHFEVIHRISGKRRRLGV